MAGMRTRTPLKKTTSSGGKKTRIPRTGVTGTERTGATGNVPKMKRTSKPLASATAKRTVSKSKKF